MKTQTKKILIPILAILPLLSPGVSLAQSGMESGSTGVGTRGNANAPTTSGGNTGTTGMGTTPNEGGNPSDSRSDNSKGGKDVNGVSKTGTKATPSQNQRTRRNTPGQRNTNSTSNGNDTNTNSNLNSNNNSQMTPTSGNTAR